MMGVGGGGGAGGIPAGEEFQPRCLVYLIKLMYDDELMLNVLRCHLTY